MKSSIFLLEIFLCVVAVHTSHAGVFFSEGYEAYRPNEIWATDAGGTGGWAVWPTAAVIENKVVQTGMNSKRSLSIFNPGEEAVYLRSLGNLVSREWKNAVEKAKTVNARFSFYIPKEMAAKQGSLFTVYFEQKGDEPLTSAMLTVANDPRQGLVVLASNGPGDGFVAWETAGKWDFDKWVTVEVNQRFHDRTYDIRVDKQPTCKNCNFRNAVSWPEDLWGKAAQWSFSIAPGTKVNFDDLSLSTEQKEH